MRELIDILFEQIKRLQSPLIKFEKSDKAEDKLRKWVEASKEMSIECDNLYVTPRRLNLFTTERGTYSFMIWDLLGFGAGDGSIVISLHNCWCHLSLKYKRKTIKRLARLISSVYLHELLHVILFQEKLNGNVNWIYRKLREEGAYEEIE